MKSPIPAFLLVATVAISSPALFAQASTSSASADKPALSPAQFNEGFKSGFVMIVNQALTPANIKVAPPKLIADSSAALEKMGKGAVTTRFNAALAETVSKGATRAAELLKNAARDLKIEDGNALISGTRDEGTKFFRKAAVTPAFREALMSTIKQAANGAGLATKARELLNTLEPAGVRGGARAISDLEDHIYKQVLEQSLRQITQREVAVRADPSQLKGNALAQKVFEQAKK